MKSWIVALIAGLAVLVVIAGIGGYLLGKNAGIAQANSVRQRFMAERFGQAAANGTPWPGANGGFQGAARGQGLAAAGTVKSVEGNIIVVATRNGDVKVQVSDTTPVQKMGPGTLKDIQPGLRITVAGQADSSGLVTASSVQLMPTQNQ